MSKILKKSIESHRKILIDKKINLGIEILRAYICFSIIIIHFLNNEEKNKIFMKFIFHCYPFYVPTFFLISFYFSYNIISSKNIKKIKERFIKILVPYIIWPLFLWILTITLNYKSIKFNYEIIRSIYMQLLIGYYFYRVFWFQFDLIIITIFILIVRFSFNNYLICLRIIGPCLFFINEYYYNSLNIYNDLIGSIRPLLISFIYSLTGFFLGHRFIIKKLQNIKFIAFILIIPAFILIYYNKKLIEISISVNVLIVDIVIICLFICFALIPFELFKKDIIYRIVKQLTSYTGGIYYIHVGVKRTLSTYYKILSFGDFKSCAINYLISYFICFVGSTIFQKTKLKYLFL